MLLVNLMKEDLVLNVTVETRLEVHSNDMYIM